MRTITNSNYTINYPDVVNMAFDTIGINITAQNPSQNPTFSAQLGIGDIVTGRGYSDKRVASGGELSFDLSPYIRALISAGMNDPFTPDANGYLPLTGQYEADVIIDGYSFTFQFLGVWGTLSQGEKWNADKTVHIWDGFPNTWGLFVQAQTQFNGETFNRTGIITNQKKEEANSLAAQYSSNVSPWNYVTPNQGYTTITTIDRGIAISIDEGAFGSNGNHLSLTSPRTLGKITAPKGWKIVSWSITVYKNQGSGNVYFRNSKGEGGNLSTSITINTTNVNAYCDYFQLLHDTEESSAEIFIDNLTIAIAREYSTDYPDNNRIAKALNFLTYQRTGNMSVIGIANEIILRFKVENACDNGIFFRWIGRDGLPVSWLFRQKDPSHKVKGEKSLRSSMRGNLIDNSKNGMVYEVSNKTEEVTLTCAYPYASKEEYDIIRGITISPIVEMWDEVNEYWCRVTIEDGTFTRKGMRREDFEFKVTLPNETVQQV